MRETTLLEPIDPDDESVDVDKATKHFSQIQECLRSMDMGQLCTYDEFLQRLHITEHEYIIALRSSLKTTTVFLKRTPWEIR